MPLKQIKEMLMNLYIRSVRLMYMQMCFDTDHLKQSKL